MDFKHMIAKQSAAKKYLAMVQKAEKDELNKRHSEEKALLLLKHTQQTAAQAATHGEERAAYVRVRPKKKTTGQEPQSRGAAKTKKPTVMSTEATVDATIIAVASGTAFNATNEEDCLVSDIESDIQSDQRPIPVIVSSQGADTMPEMTEGDVEAAVVAVLEDVLGCIEKEAASSAVKRKYDDDDDDDDFTVDQQEKNQEVKRPKTRHPPAASKPSIFTKEDRERMLAECGLLSSSDDDEPCVVSKDAYPSTQAKKLQSSTQDEDQEEASGSEEQ